MIALVLVVLLLAGASPARAQCEAGAARPWIDRWFAAWELTSREILKLPDAPPPTVVFFDSACVFTMTGGEWRAAAHHDSLALPDGKQLEVQLLSFAGADRRSGPYFVMAAPSYWAARGIGGGDHGVTGVFLHEFAHTRQIAGVGHVLGPIDSTWKYDEELDDDAVQRHFGADSAYAAAALAERDLLYRAAGAKTTAEARALAREALAMIRRRHARWFTGDRAEFARLDDLFLSMEGAAQWAAAAWLSHPKGGGMTREAAVAKMIGRRRWWVQDEGLGLFLVVDRLLPGWPLLVFGDPSAGAIELLERATR